MSSSPTPSRLARLCLRSYAACEALMAVLRAAHAGFWLGVLRRETLQEVADVTHAGSASFAEEAYNQAGLREWEARLVERQFTGRRTVLVAGAGGGREVLSLLRAGHEVAGFDCNASLVSSANALLTREGWKPCMAVAPPDGCPQNLGRFDGILVGWGVYTVIQGRTCRVNFLRALSGAASEDCPILFSFFARTGHSRSLRLVASLGNVFRRILGRERLEMGDDFHNGFVHHFIEAQIRAEVEEAGLELVYYAHSPFGHAVAYPAREARCLEADILAAGSPSVSRDTVSRGSC